MDHRQLKNDKLTMPILYIFSGLPGVGKSTLAKGLSRATRSTYLRIDTIEQAIRDLFCVAVEAEGYRLSYRVASDNLANGLSVVADSCSPITHTRREWNEIALNAGAQFIDIEVVCSDLNEHQNRVENRNSEIPGLQMPTWQQVRCREYHPWDSDRITIDTASKSIADSLEELLVKISEVERSRVDQKGYRQK